MQIEVYSHPKARSGTQHGDDVALIYPGLGFAVLDGATDPGGARYNGQSGGRIAAEAAARMLVSVLTREGNALSINRIGDALSAGVAAAAKAVGAVMHPPSTTLAAAIETEGGFRLLVIGDSGIRINGDKLIRPEKPIDQISTKFRLAVRRVLAERVKDTDILEATCRTVITRGLDSAVENAVLTEQEAMQIIGYQMAFSTECAGAEDDLRAFLRQGLASQPRFANDPGHPLGFASIIGTPPCGFGIVEDFLSFDDFMSLEIFSDGYFDLPRGTRIADWEARFAEVERLDFAKAGAFPSVKGSTSREFSDDRTVICLNRN